MQADSLLCPTPAVWYLPPEQDVHFEAPVVSEYLPLAHLSQTSKGWSLALWCFPLSQAMHPLGEVRFPLVQLASTQKVRDSGTMEGEMQSSLQVNCPVSSW